MSIPQIRVVDGEFQVNLPEVEPANPNGVDNLHDLITNGYRLDPQSSQWPTGMPQQFLVADDQGNETENN
jgi:hypothetical protein